MEWFSKGYWMLEHSHWNVKHLARVLCHIRTWLLHKQGVVFKLFTCTSSDRFRQRRILCCWISTYAERRQTTVRRDCNRLQLANLRCNARQSQDAVFRVIIGCSSHAQAFVTRCLRNLGSSLLRGIAGLHNVHNVDCGALVLRYIFARARCRRQRVSYWLLFRSGTTVCHNNWPMSAIWSLRWAASVSCPVPFLFRAPNNNCGNGTFSARMEVQFTGCVALTPQVTSGRQVYTSSWNVFVLFNETAAGLQLLLLNLCRV